MSADPPANGRDFGALLRQRRRTAGLTQSELARLAGLAVRTVREVERGRTVRPQRTTAVLLADALALYGDERAGFLGTARGEGPPTAVPHPRAAAQERRRSLPAAPPLIGRDTELARLAELVCATDQPGPLALVGVAGVGKSVLALAVAHRVAGQFPGGVVGVATDHDLVASEVLAAISTVFGVTRVDGRGGWLHGERALLVLDGVDRSPAPLRRVLAQLPPGLRVITTGRAPLSLPGEQVWPVTPLELPPAGTVELAEATRYPATALFLRRLAQVRPEPPAPDEVPALVGLVRRLGGLPLALELAAGHGRLLRLPQILQRYGDRVLDLGGGDEQTLREAVAGSYRLLTSAEQAALRRLAAFRHRWSVELAEQLLAVGGVASDPVPLLDRLVSRGLVGVRGTRENRFRTLDVVRDFATEQAERLGELPQVRRAHAIVIARVVDRIAPALAGPGLRAAVDQLDDLAGEVWAALNHAANDDPPTALLLAARLPRWWRLRGRDEAGRGWLRRLLADPRTAGVDPTVRAWAMLGQARLADAHGDGLAEWPAALTALTEFRRLREVAGELAARRTLSSLCLASGRYDEAREQAESALSLAMRHARHRDAAMVQRCLAWHELRVANLTAARRRLAAVDRLAAQSGDQRLRLLATAGLAEVSRLAGQPAEAVATGRRALGGLAEWGDPLHRRRALGTLGQALAALGRCADAERVVTRLRADLPLASGGLAGTCAMIEARLALARGDRVVAVEWFTAAATALRSGEDRRELLAAMVELTICLAGEPERQQRVAAELRQLCVAGGFVLLESERARLAGLRAAGDRWFD